MHADSFPNGNPMMCGECGQESGTSLVCRSCLRLLSDGKRKRYMRRWHEIVVESAGCRCVGCGKYSPFENGELCGDHIKTKGSRPDLVLDVTNGRCVCYACHVDRHTHGL